jgi:tRNA (guanosine-2'-O-)-methyltransferase
LSETLSVDERIEALSAHITPRRLERIREVAGSRTRTLAVVLEDIDNPFNATAVTRTAEGLGIQDVHVIENEHRFALHQGVTLGAAKWLTMHRYAQRGTNNTAACLDGLIDEGYRLVATSPHLDGYTPDTLPLGKPVALVFGYEKTGISAEAASRCTTRLRLPMYGFVESFNITVSAGMALSRLRERVRTECTNEGRLDPEEQRELVLAWVMQSIPERVRSAILKT